MIEARIDASELNDLLGRIAKSPEVLKDAKKKAFDAAAPKLKQVLDAEIGGTGKVQSWQEQYVGSKGGYAAVRPKSKTYTDKSNRYAVGYVTNAINRGHRFPGQGVRGKKRNGQVFVTGSVPGKHFYEKAQVNAEPIVQEAAEQIVGSLIKHLEG